MAVYKRILLKLSGEALADQKGHLILDSDALKSVAKSVKAIHDAGVEVAVVVGAGNIWRGKLAQDIGIDHASADYMGMLGTIINSLALQSAFENVGLDVRVQTALEVRQVAEPYIRRRAIRHLEKGRVVIFGGGTGNPFFTTDTTAALRAKEIEADAILMAKNGVDGVYSANPATDKFAVLLTDLTYTEMLDKRLEVMDNTALTLCMNETIEIRVFNMSDPENYLRVINGEKIGSTIRKE